MKLLGADTLFHSYYDWLLENLKIICHCKRAKEGGYTL